MAIQPTADFDVDALYDALDEQRRTRGLSWSDAAREISEQFRGTPSPPISASTLSGMRGRGALEGDGVLQILRWLGRAPESFVPGHAGAPPLPDVPTNHILRFDTKSMYDALDARRTDRGMSWTDVAREIGGASVTSLTRLSQGGRATFPLVVRIAAWLERPVADFTRAAPR